MTDDSAFAGIRSEADYRERFPRPAFGLGAARAILASHGIDDSVSRKIEGSNLVFRTVEDLARAVFPI